MNAKTVITTAKGDVIEFAGWSAKFIVAHPRLSFWCGIGLGFAAGRLF
jgi:hypothetical protein